MKILLPLLALTLCMAGAFAQDPANLLLWYKMDAIPVVDSSPNARPPGVAIGNPVVVPGKIGQSILFNNTNQDQLINAGVFPISGDISVTAWFQITNPADNFYMKIVSTKSTFEETVGFEVQLNPSMKQLTFIGSGTDTASTAANLNLVANTWYHVAMVATGGNGKIYFNGVDVTSDGTLNAIVVNPNKAVLVASSNLTAPAGGAWRGSIDDLRIYSVPLTADQVTAIFVEGGGVASTEVNTVPATVTDTNIATTQVTNTGVATTQNTETLVATENTETQIPTENTENTETFVETTQATQATQATQQTVPPPNTNTQTETPSDGVRLAASATIFLYAFILYLF